MKAVIVVGVFDETDAAARVLHQLAESPLDPQSVSVLHRDPALQHDLSAAAGFLPSNALFTAAVAGAVVGAAIGAAATTVVPLLGYLLNAALGSVVGALVGATSGVLSRPLPIPDADAAALAAAVDAGSIAVIVRAEGMPTAQAIGDLFRAAGARLPPPPEPASPAAPPAPSTEGQADSAPSAHHDPFRPPDRRGTNS